MKTTNVFNNLLHQYFTDSEIIAHRKQAAISSRLEMWRVEHKMTQKQFAEFVGVTQAMVSKWESGEYNFTIKTLSELSDKLGIDINQLFTGDCPPKSTVSYILIRHETTQTAAPMDTSFGFSAPVRTSIQFPGGVVA